MSETTRRQILRTAVAATAASQARIFGANEKVNVAIVGLGGRGTNHLTEYLKNTGFRVAAIVDVNQAAQERAIATVKREQNYEPKAYADMREAFADKGIDAVSIATPNHWHVLSALWAVKAGKDVYCEKPVSHNIFEGQQLVAAARKYGRIVQVGQQSRSIPHKQKAMQMLREGVIGKVYMAKAYCYKRRKSIGHKPDAPTPPGIDWDLFLGPAPLRAFNELRFKYNWHWFWDTGNGDIGNQGVHEMDVALWGMGKTTFPKSVFSTGGKLVYDDDQETPNTQFAQFDFGDGTHLQFEVRGLLTPADGGLDRRGTNTVGDTFFGEDGALSIDGSGFKIFKGEEMKLELEEKATRGVDTNGHIANFLTAVKSRKHTDLNCDVAVGALSAAFCHLANISYRTGRKLDIDPAAQRFLNNSEANRMLTRNYRAPYVVPEKI